MSDQVFISYRRDGGDITAKLICEALKNSGYTVFFDYDSISGGFFDERIIKSIENCNDFILVLPKNALDRCVNADDWVRAEISCALKHKKNIIPVMLPDFEFPANLPEEIADISRVNAVPFIMAYFEGVISAIIDRMTSKSNKVITSNNDTDYVSKNLKFTFDEESNGYSVAIGKCTDTEIRIPDTYNGKVVVSIAEDGFRDCSALKKVILPETIISIGESAFYNCTMLENINIPSKVTDIGRWAFYRCSSIKTIVLPKSVKNIGTRAFTDCTSLLNFTVDKDNRYYCDHDEHLYTRDMRTFIAYACGRDENSYTVPDGVTKIEDCAFSYCSSLTNVILPDSVTHIEEFAFVDCGSLESITLPRSATSIGNYAFNRCSSLTSVTVPQGVTKIGENTFKECTSLKTIALPETIISIGKSAFCDCTMLENINIPSKVTDIGKWAFWNCSSLRSIKIPKSVKSIGSRVFGKCEKLEKIDVSIFNSHYRSAKNALFTKDMKKLVAHAMGVKDTLYTIPLGVIYIEECAFSGSKLESIVISGTVADIGEYSFSSCSNLKAIYFDGTVETYKNIKVKSTSFNNKKIQQIQCKNGTVEI